MKVLVGVDGSSNSFAAVAFVGRLIAPDRDELMLFFATPSMTFDDERLDPAVEERARSVLSRAVLDAALERLPPQWRAKARQNEIIGPPGPSLLAAASEYSADLIAVGFRGTSSIIEQFILGSVSRAVLKSAKVPVLVVKAQGEEALKAGDPSRSEFEVLAAYDPADRAEPIVNSLQLFTWPDNAQLYVMTVVRPMFLADLPDWVQIQPRDPDVAAMADEWKKEHEQNLGAARDELERFRKLLAPCFMRGSVIVAEGRPAEQIVAKAEELGIDLIVLGAPHGGRLERLFIGSTTESVLASAACSVLVTQ
jgi:nucleotide-binding universal stress UspA family protein